MQVSPIDNKLTVEQWAIKCLTSNGMSEATAKRILPEIKNQKGTEGLKWSDKMSGYPKAMFAALGQTIGNTALEWIKKEQPNAWYLIMFDPSHEIHNKG